MPGRRIAQGAGTVNEKLNFSSTYFLASSPAAREASPVEAIRASSATQASEDNGVLENDMGYCPFRFSAGRRPMSVPNTSSTRTPGDCTQSLGLIERIGGHLSITLNSLTS